MVDYQKIKQSAWKIQDYGLAISTECNSKDTVWNVRIKDYLKIIEDNIREIRRELNDD